MAEPKTEGTRDERWIDGSRPVRSGEELPLQELEAYLLKHIAQSHPPLLVEQFPSGFSNLTYLLRLGDQELVLRRPPFGNRVKSAHDMGREHRVLSRLQDIYPQAPRPYLYCEDESVLGAPFYVMERRRGIILRRTLPDGLELPPATARALSEAFIDHLARLHSLDYAAAGLADLGRPEGYVERQVLGWSKRYGRAKTHDWAELEAAGRWLAENRPAESGAALVHNDYKYDNVVLDPRDLTRIVAVLDWEMCTLGDPLMDLGCTLAYWTEASDDPAWKMMAFGPTSLPGSLTRAELAARYAEHTSADLSNLVYYFAFGLFKLAVIVQQIYYRYAQGHTQDPRFAQLHHMTAMLGRLAARAIEEENV